jgi:hypothetical protein
MNETKSVWVAYTNTDCTEGRGFDVPIAVCTAKATAIRLARKQYVQGHDGPVREMQLVKIDGKWYAPSAAINVIDPTAEDVSAHPDDTDDDRKRDLYHIVSECRHALLPASVQNPCNCVAQYVLHEKTCASLLPACGSSNET